MQHLREEKQGPLAAEGEEVPRLLGDHLTKPVEDLFQKQQDEFFFSDFERFPEEIGWQLNDDGGLELDRGPESRIHNVLQAWLFFGLIAFVVRTEKPILNFRDLVTQGDGAVSLTTARLPRALQDWHDGLKQRKDKAKVHRNLIEVDRALELARKVVRTNFKEVQPTASSEQASKFPYSADIIRKLELCLMILGETLSAVKVHIVKDLGLTINGWFMDDDEGWGPPSYVLKKMETEKWCRRAQTVLRGQLGSSAILLYAALANREKEGPTDKSGPGRSHDGCSPARCDFVHREMVPSPPDGELKPKYTTGHHDVFCKLRHSPGSAEDTEKETAESMTHKAQGGHGMKTRPTCSFLGPDMKKVADMLKNVDSRTEAEEFPLFRIVSEKCETNSGESRVVGVSVERWSRQKDRPERNPEFVALSHVWSQGMGNEDENELHECQLEFIRTIVDKALDSKGDSSDRTFRDSLTRDMNIKQKLVEPTPSAGRGRRTARTPTYVLSGPFWMDTLAIPVKADQLGDLKGEFTQLKQGAIRQIYHIYNSASRVIVLDKELYKCREGLNRAQSVIKVLTSHWMRRMWTLQEAFLCQRLSIIFRDTADRDFTLKDLEDLTKRDVSGDDATSLAFRLSLAELNKRKLYDCLMGDDREIRNRRDHPFLSRGSLVIASAWKSARWRNTSRQEDETLALSLLLNLDYRGSYIERSHEIAKKDGDDREQDRHRMVRDFWTLIHRTYEGSIPAGLIFLPGEKLPKIGFGWAPKTLMSGGDESYPYPLKLVGRPTELRQGGLLVQYPGFLLYGGKPKLILGTDHLDGREFAFPTERRLSEWYKATAVYETPATDENRTATDTSPAGKIRQRLGVEDEHDDDADLPEFGIILSRPKPSESPVEIGLLVEVYRKLWRRKEPERTRKKIHCCQIIHRVEVCRIPRPDNLDRRINPTDIRSNANGRGTARPLEPDQAIGEVMPEDTLWCVDGYQDNDKRNAMERSKSPDYVASRTTMEGAEVNSEDATVNGVDGKPGGKDSTVNNDLEGNGIEKPLLESIGSRSSRKRQGGTKTNLSVAELPRKPSTGIPPGINADPRIPEEDSQEHSAERPEGHSGMPTPGNGSPRENGEETRVGDNPEPSPRETPILGGIFKRFFSN